MWVVVLITLCYQCTQHCAIKMQSDLQCFNQDMWPLLAIDFCVALVRKARGSLTRLHDCDNQSCRQLFLVLEGDGLRSLVLGVVAGGAF